MKQQQKDPLRAAQSKVCRSKCATGIRLELEPKSAMRFMYSNYDRNIIQFFLAWVGQGNFERTAVAQRCEYRKNSCCIKARVVGDGNLR